MKLHDVVFVDYGRSAFGKLGGCFKDIIMSDLGGNTLKLFVEKTKILERGHVDGVIAGSANNDLQTITFARYMVQVAGMPYDVTGTTVEMQCGSGITSINHAAWKIALGISDVMIAGGAESLSTVPAKFPTSSVPYKMMPPAAVVQKLAPLPEQDGPMIGISDRMAEHWHISREECDEFAYNSQMRLQKAYASGLVGSEILPYVIPATKKTPEITIDKDEHPRADTTYEKLAKLPSVFPGGVTTAGNASGLNDGAAFVLMMSAEKAEEYGYKPIARWVTGADIGCVPNMMGIGPSFSSLKAMKQSGLTIADIDVFECNEAFAAQNLSVIKDMEEKTGEKIDITRWNPNGGAIAVGHPNGASGPRIVMFGMMHLTATGGRYGCISACCGGGQGTTTIIENLIG